MNASARGADEKKSQFRVMFQTKTTLFHNIHTEKGPPIFVMEAKERNCLPNTHTPTGGAIKIFGRALHHGQKTEKAAGPSQFLS